MEKLEKASRAALVLCILFLIGVLVFFFLFRASYFGGTSQSDYVRALQYVTLAVVFLTQAIIWGFLRYVLRAYLQKEHWS